MHLRLPFLLCALATALRFEADAEQMTDPRYKLGKALLRRAREINETAQSNEVLEDKDSEMSEEERERVQQIDSTEDIFVGSGNHVYESQGKSETADSKGEETSGDEDEAEEDESRPTSGDSDEGDDDDDEAEQSEDDDDDSTEKKNDKEGSTEDENSSGSGLIENKNPASRSTDASISGSGSADQTDESGQSDQSGSGESTIQESLPASASQDQASGAAKETEDDEAFKKSEVEETPSGDSEDEEDSGSAEVIRKGIESLSRLLTPVASGYDFELYSGKVPKNDKKESEGRGENEKGENNDAGETHVKQCKRVCEDPMTYEQCAVPRCGYKIGTIKDLCIYLCKHQTPVCRQECE